VGGSGHYRPHSHGLFWNTHVANPAYQRRYMDLRLVYCTEMPKHRKRSRDSTKPPKRLGRGNGPAQHPRGVPQCVRAMLFGANTQELNVWSLSMKTLLLLSIIAVGATVTASTVRLASIPDLVASIRSITMIGEAQAQSRRDVRCRKGGYANNRYYCNLERARARGLVRR
jgi:hypothetical protein